MPGKDLVPERVLPGTNDQGEFPPPRLGRPSGGAGGDDNEEDA